MNASHITPLEPENRIQLPTAWAERLGLNGQVVLDQTPAGILIRPARRYTWDEISATKLVVRSAPPDPNEDNLDNIRDEFLF
jgi:hypothetical protein